MISLSAGLVTHATVVEKVEMVTVRYSRGTSSRRKRVATVVDKSFTSQYKVTSNSLRSSLPRRVAMVTQRLLVSPLGGDNNIFEFSWGRKYSMFSEPVASTSYCGYNSKLNKCTCMRSKRGK